MSEIPFQKQAEIWGKAYEILVKRGVLACFIERNLLDPQHALLAPWREHRLLDVSLALNRQLGILDETVRERVRAAIEHMAVTAFGVGYTATREYLNSIGKPLHNGRLQLRALWCPLALPEETGDLTERMEADRSAFHREFGMQGIVDERLSSKGEPANADFILWLSGEHKEDYLLVQEYSFDMPREIPDFRRQDGHLSELLRHQRLVDSRGVFAHVMAEVDGESFQLSETIRHHLGALTSNNKPFYKLCQACSYADRSATWLRKDGVLVKPCNIRALAITPNGLESLAAVDRVAAARDPRRELMTQMGRAYREARKLEDGDDEGLIEQIESVFSNIIRRLPKELRAGLKPLRMMPQPGEDYVFEFEETVPEFANPAEKYELGTAVAMIDDNEALTAFFGQRAPEALEPLLAERARDGRVTLRDLHASAIVAGMRRSKAGQINVIALEGNPGIGKTTAIRHYLEQKSDGYLFLYVSPRVVINRDVTESLARRAGMPNGILTITSNAALIAGVPRWYQKEVRAGRARPKHIDGAVVADGIAHLNKPDGSILVLDPAQEREIDHAHAGSRIGKTTLSENEDLVEERPLVGVLSGMARITRELLALNPGINRVVLTAALQGFREKSSGKTTMDALSLLFKSKAADPQGVRERQAFAKRIPNIVVMVDELAGDGAGAPFVHAVGSWLNAEFIACFEEGPSPFTITLVVSDASLGNDIVLSRYLSAGPGTPDKVLISRSRGRRAFALAVSDLRVGIGRPRRVLHVMTNSFPASALTLQYKVNMSRVRREHRPSGELETVRQAIRRQAGNTVLDGAKAEILDAVQKGANQVIYFAQDKLFLGELKERLAKEPGLSIDTVQVLDSSVPGYERKRLIEPTTRDGIKVFLMTSSGARGVSFPKADWIIAAVPRFNIEAALMEIAQLIYRGRGNYINSDGEEVSGDHVHRRLVMRVDDYLVPEEDVDVRQWLRQSIDLMTLLVMLRATILTRITGDAGLRQSLAVVPVGAVGLEELVSLMSQSVRQFVSEAGLIERRVSGPKQRALVKEALANVNQLFSRMGLHATARKGNDARTMVRYQDVRNLTDLVAGARRPLLVFTSQQHSIPDHLYVAGPVFVENWGDFDTLELFRFEGHTTEVNEAAKSLVGQLHAIDANPDYPASLRQPAANLLRILQRERQHAANEFNTLKNLKSPNTWIAVPSGYAQLMSVKPQDEGRPFEVEEPALWQTGLAQVLSATSAVMPPIPSYAEFPWVASVGNANPLKLDTVFDDRYFMASNELNLLNALLLADVRATEHG